MYESEWKMTLPSNVTIKRGQRSELNLLEDSDFGIVNKKEINNMAEFVKNDNQRNNKTKGNFNRNKNNPPRERDYGSKKRETLPAPDVCAGTVEYKIGKLMADEILKAAKSKSGKLPGTPQEVLCRYVNQECGLKGYCVKVLVDIN